ncbi:hypothetical protein MSG28_002214 [Choristoneura fumiferana]|uniref:Uncharacterized protein n=1 Tax=Choristoneura fumiferana TaxID=7141 RepID=A0ACC0JUM6_CHOFU|nr:hypothetical protein MSG28_002214 [Choristoneura fumiferana]
MQVLEIDNVKIYNLSAGKSLPDWLTERKKRTLLKKNVDLRRRIELIQEFDMPGVSTSIRASKDGQYIMAAGIYKPRIKCFDVNNLSLKFERCLDSEVLTFEILSDDYTKIVFLQCDRYVEFHVGHGRHYRLRVPKFGREIAYHKPSCDLFVVGASSDIYRLNLEVGQFMAPYTTKAHEINCCSVNEEHGLLVVGTESGHVEAWDPRTKSRQGVLDCALHCTDSEYRNDGLPVITSIKFDGPLKMGVGTSTGHVLLYDLRSSKPLLVKDHMNGLPIKKLEFHKSMDYVYSMDSTVVKIWDKNTGKQYTSIESSVDFNDLCVIPNTGLSMMAVEDQKMQVYYIPSLGPAPRWCAFLDNLTEELESSAAQTVYDDYKFVTKQELESLGLDHLLGTNLLRAYMHGYFVDVRLYKRAKSIAEPFAFEEYKRRKIREKIEQERPSRIKVEDNLPKVNRELASRLMDDDGRKKKSAANLLKDNRFKAMFENPDFEVDKSAEEFRLLNPVLSRLDKDKSKSSKIEVAPVQEDDPDNDSDMELYQSSEEESSDDDRTWVKEVKKQHKIIRRKQQDEEEPELNEKVYEVSQVPRGDMGNKLDNLKFSNDYVASDLLDSHVLGHDKLEEPAMERSVRSSLEPNSVDVFLLSSYAPQGMPSANPKRLLRLLWFFIILSVLWMCLSLCSVNLMMAEGTIMFRWLETSSPRTTLVLKIMLVLCTLIHDMVQATIITSYCLQAQLLQAHLVYLKERLLNRSVTPLNWMREIAEFQKLLKYLNNDLAPAVCLFTIVNISWVASGAMWMYSVDKVDTKTEPIAGISMLNLLLWLSAAVVPFVQAARLSKECRRTQFVGHELCVRPFLHQDTPHEDISAVLLYASTLKLRAKLFNYPIAGRYLWLILTFTLVALFSLGMCHYI